MKIKSLLLAAAVAATVGQASAFEWTPVSLFPMASTEVTSSEAVASVSFQVYGVEGIAKTDVMPVWLDENDNEIVAVSGLQDDWNPNLFVYEFNPSDFKSNGEYLLLFPEGLLVNAAGEKSDKVVTPYTFDIPALASGLFDDFKVLSVDPDLTEPQAVWNDQVVTINTNHNEAIGVTTLSILDTTTQEYIVISSNFSTNRELDDSAPISWEVVGPYKFFEGHNYKAEFIFYNGVNEYSDDAVPTKIVDRATFEFTGRVEGFKYSDVTLVSVEPEPLSFVISDPSQAVFTYTFSGPVSIYKAYSPLGQNGQEIYPASCLSSNEDNTVWTLDLSDNSYVNSIDAMLTVCICVRDAEGYQLRGDYGEEAEACYQAEWECELDAFPIEIVVPESGAMIERLTEVVVKSGNGEMFDWAYGEATIQTRNRQLLGTLYYEIDPSVSISDEVHFTQWIPSGAVDPEPLDIDTDGVYSIVFAHGCFLAGEQFDSKQSHSASTVFEISNGTVTPPSEQATFVYESVDPASGSTVDALSAVTILYPEVAAPIEYSVDVYKEGESEPVAKVDLEGNWDNWNVIDVKFSEPITEEGVYTLIFKEGVIGNEDYANTGGATGICNPEFKLVYTVGQGSAVESVAVAAEGDVYDVHGRLVLRNASASALKALPKGIYIIGGKKVVK